MRESHCVFGSIFTVKRVAWSTHSLLLFNTLDLDGEISRGLRIKSERKIQLCARKNTLGDQI